MDIKLGKYFRTFPQDKESGGAIIMRIVSNLDICSVMNFVQSGIIKLFCRLHQSEYLKDKVYKIIHVETHIYEMDQKYLGEVTNQHMSTLTNDCRCDPFCIACRVGDLEDIKYYVEQGLTPADVNMEGNITYFGREETGLWWAAVGSRHQIVDYLINHLLGGVTDIEKIDAVYKRHFHYDWDEEDTYTFEPFIMACQFGQLQHVKRYIETEKVKHTCEKTRGHLLRFDSINDEEGELREDMDNINMSGLAAAVSFEYIDIVQYLISLPNPFNINGATMNGSLTCVMLAAKYNQINTDLVELLLSHPTCPSINEEDGDGHTALDFAFRRNGWHEETDIVREMYDFLRERGGLRRHEIPGIYFGYFSANDPEERVDDY